MSAEQVLLHAERRKRYLDSGGRPGADADPIHVGGVKRRSKLFDLPYWPVCKAVLIESMPDSGMCMRIFELGPALFQSH
jgi:hypothetical protein